MPSLILTWVDEIEDKLTAESLEKGMEAVRELAVERLDLETAMSIDQATRVIESHSDTVVELTRSAFAHVVTHLAIGDRHEARRLWLASEATFEERRQASRDSSADAYASRGRRDAAWDDLQDLGVDLARVLLPLLLTAL